jgi:aspartyl aminopeptidase
MKFLPLLLLHLRRKIKKGRNQEEEEELEIICTRINPARDDSRQ